jgi:hypothetical protein
MYDRSTSSSVIAVGEATHREREKGGERMGKAGKQLHQASFQFEDQ